MKKTFFNLSAERRTEIERVCLEEFITYGYDRASINRMIQKLGIAKGSFYNYTESKADLYLFFLREIYSQTLQLQNNAGTYKTDDLFDRAGELLKQGLELLRQHPLHYKLILQAELDTKASIYARAHSLRKALAHDSGGALFDNIDWQQYRFPRDEIMTLFIWLTSGIREEIKTQLNAGMHTDAIGAFIRKRLELYRKALAAGVYCSNMIR